MAQYGHPVKSDSGLAPRWVAIVGGSGAGKSWLVRQLQERLGDSSARLALDDFYLDRAYLPLQQRAQLNFDHPRAIDWPLLEHVITTCRANQPMDIPEYDFASHTRRAERRRWDPRSVVLIEGLWLLRSRTLRKLFDCRIFVDCPVELRWERRLQRDVAERGRDAASVRQQFWEQVIPMCERFVTPQVRWADVVVTSPVSEKEMGRLTESIRQALTADAPPLKSAPVDVPL